MWLFTKCGFFSAVENFNDSNTIHVRARFEGDLERLCSHYRIEPNVVETPDGDYPFRMDFPRDVWADILKREGERIDYTNFKSAVHDGTARDEAYLRIWATLRGCQNKR